jgi:hypothetical protein
VAATSTIVDNFNGSSFAAPWVDVYGTASLDTASGRGKVPTSHTAGTPNYSGIQSGTSWTLDDVYVRAYPQATNGATVDCYTTLAFEHATVDGTRITLTYDHVAGTLVFSNQVDYFDSGATSVPFNATSHAWWRLTRSGSNLLFRTSPDAVTWTTQRTITAPAWVTGGTGSVLLDAYRASGTSSDAFFDNVNTAGVSRASIGLSLVATSAWVAGTTAPAPSYPAGVAAGDLVQLIVHSKPVTTTPATPTGWSFVGSAAGGTGAQGSGTGQTRITVFQQVATTALSGTQAVSSPSGNVALAHMRAWRAADGYLVQYETLFSTWSVSTASTSIGGTTADAMPIAAGDELVVVAGTRDDESSTITVTGVTASGSTFGTLTRDPNSTAVSATGNQISATAYRASVMAGSSTGAVTVTATSSSSETATGAVLRVRATAETVPTVAARLYLTSAPASYTPLATLSGWTDNSVAATPNHLGVAPAGAAMSTTVTETSTSGTYGGLVRQFVSLPATKAGFLSGDYALTIGRVESNAAADLVAKLSIWVTAGDTATARGVAFDGVGSVEFPTTASAVAMTGPMGFVAFEAGDRLVVEVGYRATNTVATSYSGTMFFGGTGTDLVAGGTDMSAPAWINVATTEDAFDAGLETGVATAPLGGLAAAAAGVVSAPGAGSAPLGALAAAGTGVVIAEVVPGAGLAPLGALSGSATGVRTVVGAGTAPLGSLTAAAMGTVVAEIVTGIATAPLGDLSATATGIGLTPGVVDGSAPLGALTATAVGLKTVYGVASGGEPDPEDFPSETGFPSEDLYPGEGLGSLGFTAVAVGAPVLAGVAAAPLGGLSSAATGDVTVLGVAVAALGGLAAAVSGLGSGPGTGAATFGFASSAVGVRTTYGAASGELGFVAAASGSVTVLGVGDGPLGSLNAAGTGDAMPSAATGTADLGGLTATAAGVLVVRGTGSAPLGVLSASVTVVDTRSGTATALLGFEAQAVGSVNGQGPLALPLHAGQPVMPARLRAGQPSHVHELV